MKALVFRLKSSRARSVLECGQSSAAFAGGVAFAILLLLCFPPARAQSVLVTMKLDQSQILTGAVTTLHVYGQIAPSLQAQADRIFSWHLDLLNLNSAIASPDYSALKRPASDNDPSTS